jgi:hypothetical protein
VGKADEEKRGRCRLCLEETELRDSCAAGASNT